MLSSLKPNREKQHFDNTVEGLGHNKQGDGGYNLSTIYLQSSWSYEDSLRQEVALPKKKIPLSTLKWSLDGFESIQVHFWRTLCRVLGICLVKEKSELKSPVIPVKARKR